jgi:branched-chain amino acid aminotransferase
MVWVNGERLEEGAPHVSVFDRGFTLADGVFETMLVRHGIVFRLDRHLARLARGLAVLDIPAVPALPGWISAAQRAASGEAALRLTITRGIGAGGVIPVPGTRPTVTLTLGPMPEFPPSTYEVGLRAVIASGRRDGRARTCGLKTLAYTEAIAGAIEARSAGADEALFLDVDGHCSEAAASNLFVWTGSLLLTPPVTCGALPGVTRAAVLEVAEGMGIPVAERAFGPEVFVTAGEAFLTSSLRGLAPLVRVRDQVIGGGAPGPLTRRLAAAYTALLDRECGR